MNHPVVVRGVAVDGAVSRCHPVRPPRHVHARAHEVYPFLPAVGVAVEAPRRGGRA